MTRHQENRAKLVGAMSAVIDRALGPLYGADNNKLADNLVKWSDAAKLELAESAKTARRATVPSAETWGDLVKVYRARGQFNPKPIVGPALTKDAS